MTILIPPNHLLSLGEWNELPEDNSRHWELAEGVLCGSPRPAGGHQYAVGQLGCRLHEQLPADLAVQYSSELAVFSTFPPTVRVPDLMVLPMAVCETNPQRVAAEEVLLVVEIVSPGSRRTDRVTKRNEYAEAGIPDYWIVDLDAPPSITAFQLIDGDYELNAETDDVLSVTTPAPLTINVRDLVV